MSPVFFPPERIIEKEQACVQNMENAEFYDHRYLTDSYRRHTRSRAMLKWTYTLRAHTSDYPHPCRNTQKGYRHRHTHTRPIHTCRKNMYPKNSTADICRCLFKCFPPSFHLQNGIYTHSYSRYKSSWHIFTVCITVCGVKIMFAKQR